VSYKLGLLAWCGPNWNQIAGVRSRKWRRWAIGDSWGELLAGATDAETAENRRHLNDRGVECISLQCSHYFERTL